MPAIHIRDIPKQVLQALKRRAEAHSRSLQKEVRHILLRAAKEAPPAKPLPPLDLHLSQAGDGLDTSRNRIYGDDGR